MPAITREGQKFRFEMLPEAAKNSAWGLAWLLCGLDGGIETVVYLVVPGHQWLIPGLADMFGRVSSWPDYIYAATTDRL